MKRRLAKHRESLTRPWLSLQGTEAELIGHAGELCKLLECQDDAIAAAALSVLQRMAGNKDCVADIAQTGVVPSLLLAIQTMPNEYAMPVFVKTCICRGGLRGVIIIPGVAFESHSRAHSTCPAACVVPVAMTQQEQGSLLTTMNLCLGDLCTVITGLCSPASNH
jgi:hypothetical protein